mgnify:FL=1
MEQAIAQAMQGGGGPMPGGPPPSGLPPSGPPPGGPMPSGPPPGGPPLGAGGVGPSPGPDPQIKLDELNEARNGLEKKMRAVARNSTAGKEIGKQLDEIDDLIRLLETQLESDGQQAIQQAGLGGGSGPSGPPPLGLGGGSGPPPLGLGGGGGPIGPIPRGAIRNSDF